MMLVPNSESLQEMNTCHAPDSGQFCSSKDVTFEHGLTDYYDGQHDGRILARDGYGATVGRLSFSIYNGVIKIKMVEVDPVRTGEGIASQMLANLRKEYPKEGIDPGYKTKAGEGFWKARKHLVRPARTAKAPKRAPWAPARRGRYMLEANPCHAPAGSPSGGQFCSTVDAQGVTRVGDYVELYHGTSQRRANRIAKQGFKIRAVRNQTMGGDPETNRDNVWFAKRRDHAQSYAGMHRSPVVVTVRIPQAHYAAMTPYNRNTGPDSVWIPKGLPAEYIHAVTRVRR